MEIEGGLNTAADSHNTQSRSHWLFSKVWAYIAAVSVLPYALLKTIWANGGTIGLTSGQAVNDIAGTAQYLEDQSSFLFMLQANGIDITAILALFASFFALVFVLPLGKSIPKGLLLIPGWSVGIFTIVAAIIGALQLFGLVPRGTTEGVKMWVFVITYGGFFIWGASVFLAALSFQFKK